MRDATATSAEKDLWRPSFHLCPPQGLINDPNGLIHWQGAYHVFYQWNPDGCEHLNKHWAHVRSTDLIHWETLPIALAPDMPYDSHGCYSGSAVDLGDAMALMYTGNVRDAQGGRSSYQCLALSSDGIHFEKLGPVMDKVPGYTGHFRDPKVWRQGERWYVVIGAQRAVDAAGTVVLATSPDLRRWRIVGELLEPVASCYMVECPDLFGLDGQTVLICCRQLANVQDGVAQRVDIAGYMIGDVDLDGANFTHGDFRPLDQGFDFYAPQTWSAPDGRRLMIGWMGLPLRPRTPTIAWGWTHCLTLPRELSLEHGRLYQRPLREVAASRGRTISMPDTRLGAHREVTLPRAPGDAWALDISIDAGRDADWVLQIFDEAGQTVRLVHAGVVRTLALVRHCPAAEQFDERSECEFENGVTRLQLFVDRSSVEVFVNDGEAVFTTRCYPVFGPPVPRFAASHPVVLRGIRMWSIRITDP